MKKYSALAVLSALIFALSAVGCNKSDTSSQVSSSAEVSSVTDSVPDTNTDNADNLEAIVFSESGAEVTETRFLQTLTKISLSAPEGATIYYTTDGSVPDSDSDVYSEPIQVNTSIGDFPTCLLLKAKAVFADGSESETVTHTFFSALGINTRFNNVIFSISGDPDDLFNKPNGLFYGKNYEKRGKESERPVYIEAISSNGDIIFEQNAGVRIYGAASRSASIKSLKLYARKSYDEQHGKFEFDKFGTSDADGNVIDKYDKLVLRNAGNDFQFAYIRDELNQRLAVQAGYTNCEAVIPAVVYLNGEYYGLLWLHESYCDYLLSDKYGKGSGTYEVVEGKETEKKIDDSDDENAAAAEEYNNLYNKYAYSDLTDDAVYNELCKYIDIENYLDYYAYNIYVNNFDWPQNNYKCYRYYKGEDEEYTDDERDGRWRYLMHDTDYCMGLYEQDVTVANYNNIKQIMNENSDRYSPMFTSLMQRDDCREYFLQKIITLMNGVLSADNISETLDAMNLERYSEMQIYYKHLEDMKKKDDSIWSWYENYLQQTEQIRNFANNRARYVKKYLTSQFDLADNYFD